MGQQASINPRSERRKSGFGKALVSTLDLSSAQYIPGDLPQEIILLIFKFLGLRSFYRCAFCCKSWLEAALASYQNQYLTRYLPPRDLDQNHDWKALYKRQTTIEDNIINGKYWPESLASRHRVPGAEYEYFASFQNDELIYNVARSVEMKMGEISKSETRGYCLDLDSMELTHCPYGEEIVNDYILQGDTETIWWFVDWVSFSVVETIGKKILRKIDRTERSSSFGSYYLLKPNLDGSAEVLTHEKSSWHKGYDLLKYKRFNIEVYDLKTGDMIYNQKIGAMEILAFYHNIVFLLTQSGVELYDLDLQQVRMKVGSDHHTLIKVNDDKIALVDKNEIKILELRSFTETDSLTIDLGANERIFAVAFDRWKLVVGIAHHKRRIEIYALDSKKLLQRIVNLSDNSSDNLIHLPSNGKIIVDSSNLTVYDFLDHPNINKKATILMLDANQLWRRFVVKSKNLSNFCEDKLGNLALLFVRTLYSKNEDKRMTVIFNSSSCKENEALQELFDKQYRAKAQIRNSFQLTTFNGEISGKCQAFLAYNYYPCILVFERFKLGIGWQFCKPSLEKYIEVASIENY